MKFTFKTENNGAWSPPSYYVKIKRMEVGQIHPEPPHKIMLAVEKADANEDGHPNCPWKWVTFKKESESVAEAKAWLNENIDAILAKYSLHQFGN